MKAQGVDIKTQAPKAETYQWTDKATGEIHTIPKGIDPGWDYNAGQAAWGQRISEQTMNGWRAQGAGAWETLTPGDWQTHDRPQMIPVDKPKAKLGKKAAGQEEIRKAVEGAIGGPEKIFHFKTGDFSFPVLVNAETLADHLDNNRAAFVPFLEETLTDPFEVWLSFERHKGTGKVVVRQRIIKAIELKKDRGMLVVTNSVNGVMEAWTFLPTRNLDYLNQQRTGKLIWTRQE